MQSSNPALPHVLAVGPYPQWDMTPLENDYNLHKLWLAPDPVALLAQYGASIRAVATRGELGASAQLIQQRPHLEIISCYGVGTDAIALDLARDNLQAHFANKALLTPVN